MPSATFFNLPEEKRAKLLTAARHEFARSPYEEASINQIIRAAEIPRGSFYMYFQDKEDLFHHLLGEYAQRASHAMTRVLRETGGDVFAAALLLYDRVLTRRLEEEQQQIFENLMSILRNNSKMKPERLFAEQELERMLAEFAETVDKSLLNLTRPGDLELMLRILLQVTFGFVCAGASASDPAEERRRYIQLLSILQRGMSARQSTPCNADE